MRRSVCVAAVVLSGLLTAIVNAADLQPRTVVSFDRYVRATESQMLPSPFLRIDGLPDAERRETLADVQRGELYIERLTTREAGTSIDVPGGLIHHWLGVVFVPDWRFLERDGGVYVQCEAISLTRGIPFALRWLIGPFVNSIPRESLAFMLGTTRKTLATRRQTDF